jgi:uncharacterized membrane protein
MPLAIAVVAIALSAFLIGLIAGHLYTNRQWAKAYSARAQAAAAAAERTFPAVDTSPASGVQLH